MGNLEDRLGLTTEYAYNDDQTLKSLTLPNGTVTDYTYDDLRRLVSIATTGLSANDVLVKFTYHYNDLGLRDNVTMADGRTIEWDYDDVGRLVEEHFKSAGPSPTTLLRYVYTYDAAGNRTSKKTDYDDNPNNGYAATATYTNNGYNQLTAVSGSPGRGTRVNVTGTIPTAWTLADGDVTVTPNEGDPVPAEVRGRFFIARNVPLSNGTNSVEADTDADTLAGNSPSSDTVTDVALDTSLNVSYTYNANGDLVLKSEEGGSILWSYSYSVDGWLTKVEGPNGFVEEYWYDPIGRKYKVVATAGGATTTRYFVYDGGSIVLELEKDGDDYLLEKEHVRGLGLGGGIGGLLYTRDANGTTGYFHYDGRGNAVSVTNEAREEIAYYEYDAWGNILTACGSLANEFAFSTKQASLGTGLIDFGYRWYDPSAGRWTQRDPIGYSDGVNLYHYLGGSAPNRIDPSGLEFWDAHGNPNGGPGPNDSYGQTVTYTTDNNPAESGGGPGSSRFWGIVGILCKRQWDRLTDPDQWLWPQAWVLQPDDPRCGPDPTWEQIKQIWKEDPLAAIGTALLSYSGADGFYEIWTGRDFFDGHRLSDEEMADATEDAAAFLSLAYGASKRVKRLKADTEAGGPHTRFKRGPDGRVTGYTTYDEYGRPVKRFRGTGRPHGGMKPPLVLEPKKPGGRPKVPRKPTPGELPRGY